MTTETVTISMDEYVSLKMKAEIADDAIVQLNLSLKDLHHSR